jgi:hypothetical protein
MPFEKRMAKQNGLEPGVSQRKAMRVGQQAPAQWLMGLGRPAETAYLREFFSLSAILDLSAA